MREELISQLINFIENSQQYIDYKISIREKISINSNNFDRHFTSYSNFSFILKDLRPRFSGNKLMFTGDEFNYEIHCDCVIKTDSPEPQKYIITERLSETVHRENIIVFEASPLKTLGGL